ncbi:MAG: SRPBCC family protein [Micrococcales bacterium]|nr:SRPBCC family protein [Micrococcales bacterium]
MHNAPEITRTTSATPEQVWGVLADGWAYGSWVVGASRVRAVDITWPEPGSCLHHSIGTWPAVLDDSTSVLEAEVGRRLVLSARTRPAAVQTVELVLEPTAEGTVVHMSEDVTSGPARLVPAIVRQTALVVRNREALHRLCLLAERASSLDHPQG